MSNSFTPQTTGKIKAAKKLTKSDLIEQLYGFSDEQLKIVFKMLLQEKNLMYLKRDTLQEFVDAGLGKVKEVEVEENVEEEELV